MSGVKSGVLAAAMLSLLPLAAAAQAVEISFRTSPSTPDVRPLPVFYRAGETIPDPIDGIVSFRPSLAVADSPEDRERRLEIFNQCVLLSEVKGRTILDTFADFPNHVMDGVAAVIMPAADREDTLSIMPKEPGSLLGRIFTGSLHDPSAHPFDALVGQLIAREQRYFAKFQDSDLATLGVGDGVEDVDSEELMADQQKILFDAARKLYFSRLGGPRADDRFRDESLDIARWQAVDYAVAPALIAGYLYVRGWEKKVDLLGLRWGFQLEPVRRILERFEGAHNDLVSAASLEIGMPSFPVKVIVSMGIQDGDALLDFVGIGTSVGKAKQIVSQELGSFED